MLSYQLSEKNGIGIYTPFNWNFDTTINHQTFLFSNKQKFYFNRGVSLKTKDNMVAGFINKRYHQHFKKSNFKDEQAMIDYILDKENTAEKQDN